MLPVVWLSLLLNLSHSQTYKGFKSITLIVQHVLDNSGVQEVVEVLVLDIRVFLDPNFKSGGQCCTRQLITYSLPQMT